MVQIAIDNTAHLFTIRLTTFDALIQEIIKRTGLPAVLPISYLDKKANRYVPLENNSIEPLQRKTHVRLRLGTVSPAPYDGTLNQGGKKHGHGNYRWPNGRTYIGEWCDDQMDGEGIETWPNGSRYEGQFQANKRHGYGTFTWPDGRQYIGEYHDDLRHGYGVCTFPNGYRYEGQWYQGKKHGRGVEIFPDGHRYSGIFEYDKAVIPSLN